LSKEIREMQRKVMLGRKEMQGEDIDEYKIEKGFDLSREELEKAMPDFER
jgi:hypothetical protein